MDIYTLYENVSYEFNEGKKSLLMSWDKSNKELNELMYKELGMVFENPNIFINLTFIDEIKHHIQWKEGETIHLKISSNSSSIFRGKATIQILENAYQEERTFLELNSDGYVYIRKFCGNCISHIHETEFISLKINCYYNELVYERENLVIMK